MRTTFPRSEVSPPPLVFGSTLSPGSFERKGGGGGRAETLGWRASKILVPVQQQKIESWLRKAQELKMIRRQWWGGQRGGQRLPRPSRTELNDDPQSSGFLLTTKERPGEEEERRRVRQEQRKRMMKTFRGGRKGERPPLSEALGERREEGMSKSISPENHLNSGLTEISPRPKRAPVRFRPSPPLRPSPLGVGEEKSLDRSRFLQSSRSELKSEALSSQLLVRNVQKWKRAPSRGGTMDSWGGSADSDSVLSVLGRHAGKRRLSNPHGKLFSAIASLPPQSSSPPSRKGDEIECKDEEEKLNIQGAALSRPGTQGKRVSLASSYFSLSSRAQTAHSYQVSKDTRRGPAGLPSTGEKLRCRTSHSSKRFPLFQSHKAGGSCSPSAPQSSFLPTEDPSTQELTEDWFSPLSGSCTPTPAPTPHPKSRGAIASKKVFEGDAQFPLGFGPPILGVASTEYMESRRPPWRPVMKNTTRRRSRDATGHPPSRFVPPRPSLSRMGSRQGHLSGQGSTETEATGLYPSTSVVSTSGPTISVLEPPSPSGPRAMVSRPRTVAGTGQGARGEMSMVRVSQERREVSFTEEPALSPESVRPESSRTASKPDVSGIRGGRKTTLPRDRNPEPPSFVFTEDNAQQMKEQEDPRKEDIVSRLLEERSSALSPPPSRASYYPMGDMPKVKRGDCSQPFPPLMHSTKAAVDKKTQSPEPAELCGGPTVCSPASFEGFKNFTKKDNSEFVRKPPPQNAPEVWKPRSKQDGATKPRQLLSRGNLRSRPLTSPAGSPFSPLSASLPAISSKNIGPLPAPALSLAEATPSPSPRRRGIARVPDMSIGSPVSPSPSSPSGVLGMEFDFLKKPLHVPPSRLKAARSPHSPIKNIQEYTERRKLLLRIRPPSARDDQVLNKLRFLPTLKSAEDLGKQLEARLRNLEEPG